MKKIILGISLLVVKFSFGMTLDGLAKNPHWYGASELEWLLNDILECRKHNHEACHKMRIYFQNYAPILCQKDTDFRSVPGRCKLIEAALVDEKFVQQLVKDHQASPSEAEKCAQLLAEVDNK